MKTLITLKKQVVNRIKYLENSSIKNVDIEKINTTLETLNKILSLLPVNRVFLRNKKLVKPKYTKSVSQYDLDGMFIKDFISIKLASEESGVCYTSISNCVKNRYQWTKNKEGVKFTWKYKN